MSEKFVCVNCEQNNRSSLVDLDTAGKCSTCGSDSVISASVFLSLATKSKAVATVEKKAKTAELERSFEESKTKRINSLREYHMPIRRFLERNKFHDLNLWWDGWGCHSDHSMFPLDPQDSPDEGEFEWTRYTLANSDGSYRTLIMYYDPEEEGRVAISEILRDLKKKI